MAGTTLCVSCAALPMKDRSLAIKTMQCPTCQATFGVTSYGAAFRLRAAKRNVLLSPTFLTGAIIGASLFTFVVVLAALGFWSKEKVTERARVPETQVTPNELARVPEVAVDDPFPQKIQPEQSKRNIRTLIQRIQAENGPKQDAFLLAQMDRRPELRGLPFIMGAACRMDAAKSQSFQTSVKAVREGQDTESRSSAPQKDHSPFWKTYLAQTGGQGLDTNHGVAALAQILAPESKSLRADLVKRLKLSKTPESLRVIARAAVFDQDGDVRVAAINAIKEENQQQSPVVTDALLAGIRYPMANIAKRSAQAMIAFDRKDLMPQLADMLGEPSPGDPVVKENKVAEVREVVKINHHRNCLLCHPPSQTGNEQEVPGVIPIPGNSFAPSPKEAYGNAQSQGEPMVRADTTYLRQDFSMMMPVANAAPWPEMQRFDFLVRTRIVEGQELARMQQNIQARAADYLSENHKAVIRVLTELSGQQNVAPTQVAWQRVVGGGKAEE
jgi:hypothetical protein